MKTYIKPSTDIHQTELLLMQGASVQNLQKKTDSYTSGGGITLGGKENDFSSNDLWSSDEEE